MMTLEHVRSRLRHIEKLYQRGDSEVAHYEEEDLHWDVLRAIAQDEVKYPRIAAALLIEFGRERART